LEAGQTKLLHVLEKSGAKLYTLLVKLTLREEVAEDLMQDLFVKLSSSNGFERSENASGYAWRSAINLAFDWRRRQKRVHDGLEGKLLAEQNEPSPLARMVQAEEMQQVLEATGRLSELMREVFVMRYFQQDSYEEIAERFGKQPQQVRAMCSKAMKELREFLTDKDRQKVEKEAEKYHELG